MKIKIKNYIISIEKQISLISKTPLIETQAICNGKKSIENTKNNDMQNLKDSRNEFKIGEYVQYQMQLLSNKNILSIQDVQKLQDLSYCKTKFNISFCVLIDQKLSVKDDKGYPRYYANDLYFNNYRLTSQWKEVHRKPFLNWLKTHIDIEVSNYESSYSNSILPIELIPNNNEEFLETLLKTKKATISTFYKNGKQEDKIWNASRMTAKSNVLGNLRSRQEYRNPNWQEANIVKVVVEVNKNNKEEIINNEVNPTMSMQNSLLRPITSLQDMSEGFRRWLSRGNNYNGKNYAPGTVIGYSNAIKSLSEHHTEQTGQRINIYNLSVQSIDELERIMQLYSLLGKYSEFGNTAHGTYRNAMVAYVRFIKRLNRN